MDLKDYVKKISNDSVYLEVSVLGEPEESLIYRAVMIIKREGKTSLSNRFIKCLINKLRRDHEIVKEKTDKHRYIYTEKCQNGILTIKYEKGDLKDRYKSELFS